MMVDGSWLLWEERMMAASHLFLERETPPGGEREREVIALLLLPLMAAGEEKVMSLENTMGCYVRDGGMVTDRAFVFVLSL